MGVSLYGFMSSIGVLWKGEAASIGVVGGCGKLRCQRLGDDEGCVLMDLVLCA